MDPPTDASIYDAMRKSLDNFFVSLQVGDSTSLKSFLSNLSSFGSTIQAHRHKLKEDTLLAVRDFNADICSLASNLLELEKTSNIIGAQVENDISTILEANMDKLVISDKPRLTTSQSAGRFPAYIKPSYEWLLFNLHNPYPSKEMKKTISQQSGCSVKDIDAWFIDVRKRIGWNKLRKCHFSNKQEKIIAAASHFFKPSLSSFSDDLDTPLMAEIDARDMHRSAFVALQKNAKSLYADKFPELSFSTISVDGATPLREDSLPAQHPEIIACDNLPYPTPEPSPEPYTEQSEQVIPLPLSDHTSGKRRKHPQSFSDAENDDTPTRPHKRPRLHPHENSPMEPLMSLLSPADTTDLSESSDTCKALTAKPSVAIEATHTKRKRRLSDGDSQGPAKRPHNALCLPRLQTVSDPLPSTKPLVEDLFDGWYQGNSALEDQLSDTIPSPANVEDPISLVAPLNVNLHHYEFPPYDPGEHLPETSPAHLGIVEPGAPLSPNDSNSSASESLSFTNALRDTGLGFIDATDMQFDLVPAPSYQLDFQCEQLNAPDDFGIFQNSELLSLASGYMPDSSSLLGDAYSSLNSLDSAPVTYTRTTVLGNFNYTVPRGFSNTEEREAKRARVQALREELAQLEAEVF